MIKLGMYIATIFFLILMKNVELSISIFSQPRAPNFPYFERPQYRYPYYDENGKGRLLYGYGGSHLYQYKIYNTLEGIH
ncbi:PREDICTED: uncharacterized protein LOC105366793 [Ceratosolen solmsi marchali]|uniref:Uncharacterized protein LOC105366793 n=1 Tax=Ceratosolen solmsi marchali TaxID=326594 RepID=A0AAJ7E0Y8_9HYME|nr:PREDICTED: uncharacterized protein LOC105366793 [Ceratosolen solmsi marchali]